MDEKGLNLLTMMRILWICVYSGLAYLRHFRICDSRMSLSMCGFAICGLILEKCGICDLRSGTPKKFADLR
jgi:hypothetical protein